MNDQTRYYRLSEPDRGIIVFQIWQSLQYSRRLQISFGLMIAGFIIQVVTGSFIFGALPILAGNLLLLVKGYDNRVDMGRWSPDTEWETFGPEKLDELIALDRKIRKWDASFLDITNTRGMLVLAVIAIVLVAVIYCTTGLPRIMALDGVILLVPHWVTGTRRILVLPDLLVKVNTLRDVLRDDGSMLGQCKVDIMVQIKGKDVQMPQDVKCRIMFDKQPEGFLGMYGQVVLNVVQGTSYPYFYVVLVAKTEFGLREFYNSLRVSGEIIKEFKPGMEVDVIVIRQYTTKTSGYHTKKNITVKILRTGLHLARDVVKSNNIIIIRESS